MSIKPTPKVKKEGGSDGIQTVKGMRDIVGREFFSYQGFFEKAAEIALYYGFKPIETPILENIALFTGAIGEGTDIVEKEMFQIKTKGGDTLAMRPEGTAPIMRAYLETGMKSWPQPAMLYYGGPFFRYERPQRGRFREFRQFGLEMLGTEKSIADAMVIKILMTILTDVGVKNLILEINSIGDKECRPAYRRALITYYKKRLSSICTDCRERIKTNPLRVLDCKEEKCQPIIAEAPDAMGFLCPPCKAHFKEVLEYLEALGLEYVIKPTLVRGLDYYNRTVFEISTTPEKTEDGEAGVKPKDAEDTEAKKGETEPLAPLALAGGGRYDGLARALGSKTDVPAMGAAIGVDRVIQALGSNAEELNPRIVKKPKIFFIQLGFDAKLRSMRVTEILRKAKVPIAQSLSKDSLGSQLATAERMKIPYAIILAQKEVLENTVIVRNMDTRSQDSVPTDELADYVKKLK